MWNSIRGWFVCGVVVRGLVILLSGICEEMKAEVTMMNVR